MSQELLKVIIATAETMGRELSADSLDMIERELSQYPLPNVLHALQRVRNEVRHGLTLSDVIDRIPGNHPGPEEAWSMVSKALNDEGETIVQTRPMCVAFGAALNLQGNEIAARQAFKEVYQREVAQARAGGEIMPRWSVSLGHDTSRRAGPIQKALEAGRITLEHANKLLPAPLEISGEVAKIVAATTKRLTGETDSSSD